MNLVEEQNRSLVVQAESFVGAVDHFTDVTNAGRHRRELLERPRGRSGDGQGQGGLARAGRSPEENAGETIGLDETTQRLTGADQVVLAHDVVDRLRTQSSSEWSTVAQAIAGGRREEIVAHGNKRAKAR